MEKFRKNYQLAKRYALKIRPQDQIDLVHDAYLIWFNKTGKNIFEEHLGTIFRVIRNLRDSQWQKKHQFQYRKKPYMREWVEAETHLADPKTPVDVLIEKESRETIKEHLSHFEEIRQQCFNLKMEGFKGIEIAEILDISPQLVSSYIKRMNWKSVLN